MRLKIQDGILQNPDGDDSCFTTWVKILLKLENRIPNAIFWKKYENCVRVLFEAFAAWRWMYKLNVEGI